MLLLSETVKELVRLRQYLRHQCILIEVLDVEYLARALVVGRGDLIDVCDEVLVLQEQSPELLVIVDIDFITRRPVRTLNRLLILVADLVRRDGARLQ